MEEIIKAILLGIVEGITEFLPISSTGHLILLNQWVSFSAEFTKKFDVIIQLGAILSVLFYFRKKLLPVNELKSGFLKSGTFSLWKKTIIGVIPALFLGALFHKKIEDFLFNPFSVAIALLAGGILLLFIEKLRKNHPIETVDSIDYKTALSIGLIQCLALVPGTSRSAATIIGAMLLGCSRPAAVEFSFFLAIPTMIAATGYSLLKIGFSLTRPELIVLGVGFIVSFFTAWAVIAFFMRFITKRDFKMFGFYRIVLGAAILGYFLFK